MSVTAAGTCEKVEVGDEMTNRLRKLAENICEYTATTPPWFNNNNIQDGSKRAAVLVCLFEGPTHDLRVILTRRSHALSSHSGEVALPGGRRDQNDKDDSETALREAKEEIGLDPSLVTTVATIEPCLSKHFLRVVPVVGLLTDIKAFSPVLNPQEVDAIFDVPLEMFLKNENYRSEEREWMGVKYTAHYFDYHDNDKTFVIWGLTASILVRIASIVYQRSPPFPEVLPDFGEIQKAFSIHSPAL